MKHLLPLSLISLLPVWPAAGQIVVVDPKVILQVAKQILVAEAQLDQLKTEVQRVGDPAMVSLGLAREVQEHVSLSGAGRALAEMQTVASGSASLLYEANGLYRAPGAVILTSDGRQTPRIVEKYRKFDAVTQAKMTLEDVMHDTEERRQHLRQQLQQGLGQLQTAATMAEVAKVTGVISALNTELAATDRERDAAMNRVVVQHIENQTDEARQAQARREERAADFRAASEKLGAFLTPDTSPVHLRDPRTHQP